MPMHPECRQRDLTGRNLNNPVASFLLPGTTMRARQIYLKEHYNDPLEVERADRRDGELADRTNLWLMRKHQTEAEGRPFREPFPRRREEPRPWWDRMLGRALVWIDDLPMGNVITMVLIVLFILLTFPITIPICAYAMNREWRSMLRRDYEYLGSAVPCDRCGKLLTQPIDDGNANERDRSPFDLIES